MPGLLWETHDSNPCLWRLARAQALKGEGVIQHARLAQASRRVPARDAASIGIQMGRDQDRTGDSRLKTEGGTRWVPDARVAVADKEAWITSLMTLERGSRLRLWRF